MERRVNPPHPPSTEAIAIMTDILSILPPHDREALARFYVDGQPPEEIEAALSLDADHFRELRASVRAAYFRRIGTARAKPGRRLWRWCSQQVEATSLARNRRGN